VAAYHRPPFVVGRIVNPLVAALGVRPALATRGRRTGAWRSVPVNVLETNGARYLVSTRGDAFWVRNLLRDPAAELRRRGHAEPVRATLVDDAERPALIAAYLERWSGEAGQYFRALPDPADHPVFRLEADLDAGRVTPAVPHDQSAARVRPSPKPGGEDAGC
jgi:deazaflavin-dependent oxidoreductase (nitroreductase family)